MDYVKQAWALKRKERPFGSLCNGICERMFSIEKKFWNELYQLEKNNDNLNFKEWLVKLLIHLAKKMKKITKIKRKKLWKLSGEGDIEELVYVSDTGHLIYFFDNFSKYWGLLSIYYQYC